MSLRVLVVDDMGVIRRLIREAFESLPDIEVVGAAANGRIGLAMIKDLKPDLVSLDVEMPEMDGLQVLEAIRNERLNVGVVMVSAHTTRGGELTIRALELGAFDFVTKPSSATLSENRETIKASFASIIKAFVHRRQVRAVLGRDQVPTGEPRAVSPTKVGDLDFASRNSPETPTLDVVRPINESPPTTRAEVVCLGVSTGGPSCLPNIITKLPADLNVPVLLVQHMPPLFTQSLADSLNRKSALHVKEAEDGEPVTPGIVYIAPGGKQMKVTANALAGKLIRITDEPPEKHCKPSVDYLFRSIAQHYPGRVCAVIMTGMGSDGTTGLRLLKRAGARVIAQSEESCVVFGMPKAAIEAGVVDVIAPLDSIAVEIGRSVKGFRA